MFFRIGPLAAGSLQRVFGAAALAAALGLGAGSAAADDAADPGTAIDVRQEVRCLAQTIYFEARGEPDAGKLAVGHVVMNRVASDQYPDRVCAVVRQGGEEQLHRCQFSWWCDGRSDQPEELDAWRHSQALARAVYWNFSPDPTGGAKWYHADYVAPAWRDKFERGPVIGRHVFYRPHGAEAGRETRGPQLAETPDS
jgi:spore germination cell wall hydrolase CwlJ-like protein